MKKSLNFQYLLVLGLLGLLAFYRLAMPSSFSVNQTLSEAFKKFPTALGEWQGQENPVDEKTYEILETRNVMSRLYKNSEGEIVHLFLVGSQKDRRVAHPPEVCYYGSNYLVLNGKDRALDLESQHFTAREFFAQSEKNDRDKQYVLYFYKIGDRFTNNYYAQQLQFAMDNLTKKSTQIVLIRLASSSEKSLNDFLKIVFPEIQSLNLG